MKQNELTQTVLAGLAISTLCFGTTAYAADKVVEQDLGEVVVTAERIPSKRLNTPANIAVITAKEIEENHYHTVAEALEHVNGVTITQMGGGQQDIVELNGDARVVIMLDGERLNNDQGASSGRSSADLNMIPSLKNIDRIEVVKGGGSALYGSDAVGGVINIITKKVYDDKTMVDINTGSWKNHNYEVVNQGNQGDVSWFVAGNIQRQAYFKYKYAGSSQRMEHSDYNNNGLNFQLNDKLNEHESLRLTVIHRSIDGNQFSCAGASSKMNSYTPYLNEIFNNASITYGFKNGTAAPGTLRYFNNYKTSMYGTRFSTRLQGVDYQNGWQLDPEHTLIVGTEWHQSDSSNKNSGYVDRIITTQAAYLQDTWQFANKWTFVPGIRVDHHSNFGTHWSPKAALNFRPDENTQFYANWGRVYKAPTADDLFYWGDYGGGFGMFGNPQLRPESGWTQSLGMNHLFDTRNSISMSIFQSNIHDAIRWYTSDSWNHGYVSNINREKKRGFEVAFKNKTSKQWAFDAGYSYIRREIDTKEGAGLLWDSSSQQPNGYRLGVHYKQAGWQANLLGTMGSGLSESRFGGSSYKVWDFNASYTPMEQMQIYFKVNNFTNQKYSQWSSQYYPAPGRFFQVGMKLTF